MHDSPLSDEPLGKEPQDEQLVEAYRLGDEQSFESLYYRYFKQLGYYIRKNSFYKDEDFVEETRHLVFIEISQKIKSGEFAPREPGSFRHFLYQTALNICFNENKKRMSLVKPVSEIFTDEELPGIGELLLTKDSGTDYDEINERIKEITAQLTPEELKLMKLVSEEVPYTDIQRRQEFQKYSVDAIKQKVYNIRKRMRGG